MEKFLSKIIVILFLFFVFDLMAELNNTCWSFSINTCSDDKCWYSFNKGCSFYGSDSIKPFSLDDLEIGCDYILNNASPDLHYSGLLSFISKRSFCSIKLKVSRHNFLLIPSFDLLGNNVGFKEYSLRPISATSFRGDSLYLYSNLAIPHIPFFIKECNQSICKIIVLEEKEVYFPKLDTVLFKYKYDDNQRHGPYRYRIPMEFSNNIQIDCDFVDVFISRSVSYTAILELKSEGVCPIEITQEKGKVDTVYVRSVKTDDGYKALISTRESYEKELKKLKEH